MFKRILFSALAVFLLVLRAFPLDASGIVTLYRNPLFVQQANASATSATMVSITLGRAPQVGDTMVCAVSMLAGTDSGPIGWARYKRTSNSGISVSTYLHLVTAADTTGPYVFGSSISTTLHAGCAEYANVDPVTPIASSQSSIGTLSTAGTVSVGTVRSSLSGSLPVFFSAGTHAASASQAGWTNAWDATTSNNLLSAHSQYYTPLNNGATWAGSTHYSSSPGTYAAQQLVLRPQLPPGAFSGPGSGYSNAPLPLSMTSTSNCISFPGSTSLVGIEVSGSSWTGDLVTQGTADGTNFSAIPSVNESTQQVIGSSSIINTDGFYRLNTAGLQSSKVCVNTVGTNTVYIGFTPYPYNGVVSVDNPSITTLAFSLGSPPTPIPWADASPSHNALVVPTPSATTIDDTVTPATGAHSYTYALGNLAYQQIACDFEGFDDVAAITAYIAFDAANAYPQNAYGFWLQSPQYASNITDNGQYVFPVFGAQFFDLDVTSPGNGTISVSCNPSYDGTGVKTVDPHGHQYETINAQNVTLSVSTPSPIITASPGNQITTQKYCPSTFQTLIANGGTTYSCIQSTANGSENVSAKNSFAGFMLSNSSSTGNPNSSGLSADNPANASCNGSNAGIWCGITLTGSSVVPIISGISGASIYLLGIIASNTSAGAIAIQFYQGTGGSCGTGQTVIGAPIQVPSQRDFIFAETLNPFLKTMQSDDLCAALSGSASSIYLNAAFAQF